MAHLVQTDISKGVSFACTFSRFQLAVDFRCQKHWRSAHCNTKSVYTVQWDYRNWEKSMNRLCAFAKHTFRRLVQSGIAHMMLEIQDQKFDKTYFLYLGTFESSINCNADNWEMLKTNIKLLRK